jgi:hypothetical protein
VLALQRDNQDDGASLIQIVALHRLLLNEANSEPIRPSKASHGHICNVPYCLTIIAAPESA